MRLGIWAPLIMAAGAACSSPTAAATLHRSIHDLSFGALVMTVHVGDTIEWTNDDFVVHSVTARDGAFDVTIPPGKTGRTVLTKPGTIAFFCRFHPTMTGTIDVVPP